MCYDKVKIIILDTDTGNHSRRHARIKQKKKYTQKEKIF